MPKIKRPHQEPTHDWQQIHRDHITTAPRSSYVSTQKKRASRCFFLDNALNRILYLTLWLSIL
jgi:hypothetical protein